METQTTLEKIAPADLIGKEMRVFYCRYYVPGYQPLIPEFVFTEAKVGPAWETRMEWEEIENVVPRVGYENQWAIFFSGFAAIYVGQQTELIIRDSANPFNRGLSE